MEEQIDRILASLDPTSSGRVDVVQLHDAMASANLDFMSEEVQKFGSECDTSSDGLVDYTLYLARRGKHKASAPTNTRQQTRAQPQQQQTGSKQLRVTLANGRRVPVPELKPLPEEEVPDAQVGGKAAPGEAVRRSFAQWTAGHVSTEELLAVVAANGFDITPKIRTILCDTGLSFRNFQMVLSNQQPVKPVHQANHANTRGLLRAVPTITAGPGAGAVHPALGAGSNNHSNQQDMSSSSIGGLSGSHSQPGQRKNSHFVVQRRRSLDVRHLSSAVAAASVSDERTCAARRAPAYTGSGHMPGVGYSNGNYAGAISNPKPNSMAGGGRSAVNHGRGDQHSSTVLQGDSAPNCSESVDYMTKRTQAQKLATDFTTGKIDQQIFGAGLKALGAANAGLSSEPMRLAAMHSQGGLVPVHKLTRAITSQLA